jgi:hypothetical protein
LPTILAQLYNGQLNPNENTVPEDPQYREIGKKISLALEEWNRKHSEEERKKLEAILDLVDQTHEKELFSTFSYGFRLGAGLMIDILR